MEKRGIYNKGRQGHARNVNTYYLSRQKFKKWRLPLTALLALMFVFGVAPIVGDEFKAAVLTVDPALQLATTDPVQSRKMLMSTVQSFIADCGRLVIPSCTDEGKILLNDIVDSRSDVLGLVQRVEIFEGAFFEEVAQKACRFDVGNNVVKMKLIQKDLEDFVSKYREYDMRAFNAVVNSLEGFVESCTAR